MRRVPSSRWCVLPALSVAALLLVTQGRAAGTPPDAPAEKAAETAADPDLFTGFLVAANATDVHAPEFTFRVGGWRWGSGSQKLQQIADDGAPVKAGEVIARFDFPGRDALRSVNERIQKAEAEASQQEIFREQAFEGLLLEERRKQLEARLAAINVERERALSRQQAELYRIAKRIADFEVEAVAERIVSQRRFKEAERSWQQQTVRRAQEDLKHYAYYERRFEVRAPHDGVVRYAFHARERRKVQKGDGISPGQRVMSVARDATLAVRFFVPEHRLAEIKEGAVVTVTSSASATEHQAVIKAIDFFPQELGFLLENENLANGREKAFAVTAVLGAPGVAADSETERSEAPPGFSAGTEVRVRARAR